MTAPDFTAALALALALVFVVATATHIQTEVPQQEER